MNDNGHGHGSKAHLRTTYRHTYRSAGVDVVAFRNVIATQLYGSNDDDDNDNDGVCIHREFRMSGGKHKVVYMNKARASACEY